MLALEVFYNGDVLVILATFCIERWQPCPWRQADMFVPVSSNLQEWLLRSSCLWCMCAVLCLSNIIFGIEFCTRNVNTIFSEAFWFIRIYVAEKWGVLSVWYLEGCNKGSGEKCFQAFMVLGRFCGRAILYNVKCWPESLHVCSIRRENFSWTLQWTNSVRVMCKDHFGSVSQFWLHLCIAWKTAAALWHQAIALLKLYVVFEINSLSKCESQHIYSLEITVSKCGIFAGKWVILISWS
jgi:hypothetical protein